jgi:hypothetical protein
VLDEAWSRAGLEERVFICQYLSESDSVFAGLYLRDRIGREADRMDHYLVVQALIGRHSPEDIPFLAQLLPCDAVIGREGDMMSDVVLEYLQYSIPLEYKFHRGTFSKSRKYREAIARKYVEWFNDLATPVRWAPELGCFLTVGTDRRKVERHMEWYLALPE